MSRIRTIKPDLWTDESFVNLSCMARLCYVGLWNFADDGGVYPASAKTLKMQVLPGDDVRADDVAGYVAEMIGQDLLVEFQCGDGKTYWKVASWEADQKIDRPNYRHPRPNSTNARRAFVEQSSNDQRPLGEQSPPEGKGKEGKGKEGREGEAPAPVRVDENSPNLVPNVPGPEETGDEVSETLKKIEEWAMGNAQTVQGWVSTMRYDVERFGKAWYQIPKFVTHYLRDKRQGDRAALLGDPVAFFVRNFPSWLGNAEQYDRPKSGPGKPVHNGFPKNGAQEPATYTPPPTRTAAQCVGKTVAAHWAERHLAGVELADETLHKLARCCSEDEMAALATVLGLVAGDSSPGTRAVIVPISQKLKVATM